MDWLRSDPANCHQAGEMILFQPLPSGLILRRQDHPIPELRPILHLFLRQQLQARLHPWLQPRKLKSRLYFLARSRLRSSNSSKRVTAFFTLGVPEPESPFCCVRSSRLCAKSISRLLMPWPLLHPLASRRVILVVSRYTLSAV
ncbi:hypothetical protein K443DRAFT_494383 [Laccaria amethystina LaAM-08-1]|uniref:Unplaced genomic scaffold K443scaffold_5, whole genome shotgun sequence n=1 Tax=Laccaria amethystina LaAM-08-1 TaxID=1095629 RepID=A0A0C9XV10_9AGAR|nr:hypothetical protein K443DRAFT_494383 [Laccaria amethystina LaAM-08-1]